VVGFDEVLDDDLEFLSSLGFGVEAVDLGSEAICRNSWSHGRCVLFGGLLCRVDSLVVVSTSQ
jgi:hypothetical protein